MTTASDRYRSHQLDHDVVAFSMSYQRDNLLARGLGLEHLRELLVRIARQLLRRGASLAYGGNWKETEDNFTYDLLRLIKAEQEDASGAQAGMLYNHVAWPHYRAITPKIEAQWISCCKVVRVTQAMAGLTEEESVADAEADKGTPRAQFNAAVTHSAQRRIAMKPITLPVPDVAQPQTIPAVTARILLAGKVDGYSGFLPGLFEEALSTLEARRPLFILGGFGGAAELLAHAMLAKGRSRPEILTTAWHRRNNKALDDLLKASKDWRVPEGCRPTGIALDALFHQVLGARQKLSATLRTGLNDAETRELMTTSDVATAVRLVRKGLTSGEKKEARALAA